MNITRNTNNTGALYVVKSLQFVLGVGTTGIQPSDELQQCC